MATWRRLALAVGMLALLALEPMCVLAMAPPPVPPPSESSGSGSDAGSAAGSGTGSSTGGSGSGDGDAASGGVVDASGSGSGAGSGATDSTAAEKAAAPARALAAAGDGKATAAGAAADKVDTAAVAAAVADEVALKGEPDADVDTASVAAAVADEVAHNGAPATDGADDVLAAAAAATAPKDTAHVDTAAVAAEVAGEIEQAGEPAPRPEALQEQPPQPASGAAATPPPAETAPSATAALPAGGTKGTATAAQPADDSKGDDDDAASGSGAGSDGSGAGSEGSGAGSDDSGSGSGDGGSGRNRRNRGYDPAGWRGAVSEHPDDVFRASYQPSHILTFVVGGGKSEQLFADVRSGSVVRGDFFVLKGGNMLVDVRVIAPSGATAFSKEAATSAIFMFTAKETGVFTIQVSNRASSFGSKTVAVAWLVGADSDDAVDRLSLAQQKDVEPLGLTVHRIHSKLDSVTSALAHKDVRFRRNVHLEEDTSSRIAWSTFVETVVLLGVTYLQIVYLRRVVNSAVGWV